MLIRGPFPTPNTIVQHSFRLSKAKNGELLIVAYFTRLRCTHTPCLSTLLHLRFSYRWKILSIVVPSYFDNRNISFVIKFKPFPALTDNTIQQFQISKPYKKSL